MTSGKLIVYKIRGVENPADLMTKFLNVSDIQRRLSMMNMYTEGVDGGERVVGCVEVDVGVGELNLDESSWICAQCVMLTVIVLKVISEFIVLEALNGSVKMAARSGSVGAVGANRSERTSRGVVREWEEMRCVGGAVERRRDQD